MTTDTSAEAVERLAALYDEDAKHRAVAEAIGDTDHVEWCDRMADTAATLRALLAERDAECDRRTLAETLLRTVEAERDAAKDWANTAFDIRDTAQRNRDIAYSERDAARAEVARLRKVLQDVLATAVAARSLLGKAHDCGRQPRMVVASTKMLKAMLADYDASIARARAALAEEPKR